MSRLTKRNLIATLIIIVVLAGSVLVCPYVPLALSPIIPLAAFVGIAAVLTRYPAVPALERAASGRPPAGGSPAGRLAGAAGIDDVLAALDRQLTGLPPVKSQFEQIASLLIVDRARRRFGLHPQRPSLHMCSTGQPGTGKTTAALQMAELHCRPGYLDTPRIIHATHDAPAGEYTGQTAPRTNRIPERATGGVLFIDEAHSPHRPDDPKDHGQEYTDILLQVMENDRGNLIVILAGYKNRMDTLFESNPGMSSRIAHRLASHPAQPRTKDELMRLEPTDIQPATTTTRQTGDRSPLMP